MGIEPSETARHLVRRLAAATADDERRAEAARTAAARLARRLTSEFGATAVYLFGSAVEGRLTESSDIDLAVEGLAGQDIFRVASLLDEDDLPFTVDLRALERLPARLRRRIVRQGTRLA